MEWPGDLPQLTSDYEPEEAHAIGFGRVCVVVVGGECFAVDLRHVREVFELDSVTPVPGMPASLLGVANLRGTIIPLADLREMLGVSLATSPRYVIVVRHEALQVGLLIDGVPEIRTIYDEDQLGMADSHAVSAHRFLSGLIRVDNRVSGMLQIGSLLAAIEGAAKEESIAGNR